MKTSDPRLVSLTPESNLLIPMQSTTLHLRDLNQGDASGLLDDTPIDIGALRPTGFLHQSGEIEIINSALLNDWADRLHSEQQVCCDLIDHSRLDASLVLVLRFWFGERAWCQHHRHSRYNAKGKSWHEVVDVLLEIASWNSRLLVVCSV